MKKQKQHSPKQEPQKQQRQEKQRNPQNRQEKEERRKLQKQQEKEEQRESRKQQEKRNRRELQKQQEQEKQLESQKRQEQVKQQEAQKQQRKQKQRELQKQLKQQKEQKQKRDWKEYLYNCPYLIAISLTSLAVMFVSDEIGFSAVAKDAQTIVCKSYAKMPGEQDMLETLSGGLLQDDNKNTGDINSGIDDDEAVTNKNTEAMQENPASASAGDASQESMEADSLENPENAGKRRENDNDLQNEGEHQDGYDKPESGIKTEDKPKGITNFEFYDPIPIESRYYEDAGKIALTTEYPYKKENISYFDDAAFLGDSRTLGISDYAGLEAADFYCDSGMTIFKILEEEVTYQKTGSKVHMPEVLQSKKYGKIYIMLGMNELGYGNTEMYLDQYRQVLQQIREWQPEAVIYIMANLHVSKEKNNMETEFNNININSKNAASASLANGTDVFYLDVNPVFTDEEGYLNSELTFDGVHLYAKHYDAWREFLLEHAVEPVSEQKSGTEAVQD